MCTKPSHCQHAGKERKKEEKEKEQKTLSGCRVFNFTSMVYLTQAHKVKETISISFFKYGKQNLIQTAYNELNFPAPSSSMRVKIYY